MHSPLRRPAATVEDQSMEAFYLGATTTQEFERMGSRSAASVVSAPAPPRSTDRSPERQEGGSFPRSRSAHSTVAPPPDPFRFVSNLRSALNSESATVRRARELAEAERQNDALARQAAFDAFERSNDAENIDH